MRDFCHATSLGKIEEIISPVELPPCRHRYRQVVLVSAGGQRSYLTNFESAEVLKILRWNAEDNKVDVDSCYSNAKYTQYGLYGTRGNFIIVLTQTSRYFDMIHFSVP